MYIRANIYTKLLRHCQYQPIIIIDSVYWPRLWSFPDSWQAFVNLVDRIVSVIKRCYCLAIDCIMYLNHGWLCTNNIFLVERATIAQRVRDSIKVLAQKCSVTLIKSTIFRMSTYIMSVYTIISVQVSKYGLYIFCEAVFQRLQEACVFTAWAMENHKSDCKEPLFFCVQKQQTRLKAYVSLYCIAYTVAQSLCWY